MTTTNQNRLNFFRKLKHMLLNEHRQAHKSELTQLSAYGVFNVRDFDARADFPYADDGLNANNYEDQAPAIQDAIDCAAELGRGTVWIPSYNDKTYLIKSPITLKRGVTLTGGGAIRNFGEPAFGQAGILYHKPEGANTSLFILEPANGWGQVPGVTVEDLVCYGPKIPENQQHRCFDLEQPQNLTIRHCHIFGFDCGLFMNGGIFSRIEHVTFQQQQAHAVRIGSGYRNKLDKKVTTTTSFNQCYFLDCKDIGVVIEHGKGINFHDCIFENIEKTGLHVFQGSSVALFGCYTENIPANPDEFNPVSILKFGHDGKTEIPAAFSMFGCITEGPSHNPNAPGSAGVDADFVSVGTIMGCHFARVAHPLKTSDKTQRIDYFGNTCVQAHEKLWEGIADRKKIIGELFAPVIGQAANQHLNVNRIHLADKTESAFVIRNEQQYSMSELLIDDKNEKLLFYGKQQDAGIWRVRQQVDAPVFMNTKRTLPNSNQMGDSPSDDEWLSGDETLFGTEGMYKWIPVGGFAVVQDSSEGKENDFYLVVKTDEQGCRKKLLID